MKKVLKSKKKKYVLTFISPNRKFQKKYHQNQLQIIKCTESVEKSNILNVNNSLNGHKLCEIGHYCDDHVVGHYCDVQRQSW